MIAREMTRGKFAETYFVVGFVDDAASKQGKSIHGLQVLGTRLDIGRLVKEHQIEQIVITIPSLHGREIRTLLGAIERKGAELRIVPGIEDLVDRGVNVEDIREVRVEDILGRDKVDLNIDAISSYVSGKMILVTGAGGSIGSEICRQLMRFHPAELLLFGRGENSIFLLHQSLRRSENGTILRQIIGDVINKKKLAGVLEKHAPQIIFHAGADKHVPLMEMNPDEAVLNNVIGTKNVLEVAEAYGVERVVCISTDKAVNPTSVMGCCKRIAEMLVQSGHFTGTVSTAVRFGNVLGSRGSVIPIFQEQIVRGGPVTITHPDIRRYFMTISEASQLVIQGGAMGEGHDLFLLDMGAPVRIIDLARDMIRLAGREPDKDIRIEIVGLRPGEKLHEELWLPSETRIPTGHEKIMRVVSPEFDYARMDGQIRTLTQLAIEMDFGGIVRALKAIVPEYEPKELPADPRRFAGFRKSASGRLPGGDGSPLA
jgi:FlaA1/EpsC-like NDP-sugar epimerase